MNTAAVIRIDFQSLGPQVSILIDAVKSSDPDRNAYCGFGYITLSAVVECIIRSHLDHEIKLLKKGSEGRLKRLLEHNLKEIHRSGYESLTKMYSVIEGKTLKSAWAENGEDQLGADIKGLACVRNLVAHGNMTNENKSMQDAKKMLCNVYPGDEIESDKMGPYLGNFQTCEYLHDRVKTFIELWEHEFRGAAANVADLMRNST